jgi:hypothetical protein
MRAGLLKLRSAILLIAGASMFGAVHPLMGQDAADERAVDADTVVAAIDRAEAARQRAAGAGTEWLQTESLILDARKALENGDWQDAIQLAKKAERQGLLAVQQAERESAAWRDRVVR